MQNEYFPVFPTFGVLDRAVFCGKYRPVITTLHMVEFLLDVIPKDILIKALPLLLDMWHKPIING